jgi:hypothetical protein
VVLKDEGEQAPRVVRYDLPDGAVVLKLWDPSGSRLLRWWARLLMRREIRHYRLLQGCPAVPAYRGHYGEAGLLLEYVPAAPLKRQLKHRLGQDGLERALVNLEGSMELLHARRFAHLDLHQKLNALVGPDERVWFVDLGQGVDCSRWPLRALFPLLAWVDRRALVKFHSRYAPALLPEDVRERLVERHRGTRWRRWKALRRKVRRHLVDDPATGADDGPDGAS